MLRTFTPAALLLALIAVPAVAQQKVILPATADCGVSSVRGHQLDSNDTGPSSAIRQNQNWRGFETKALLINFDAKAVAGWDIQQANLHLYVAKEDLYGVGVCEVLAPWSEGSEPGATSQVTPACWQFAHRPQAAGGDETGSLWAWPGSNLPSVSWSHPMARFSYAGPGQIKKEPLGYPGETVDSNPFLHLTIPVEPALVASLAAGTNCGFVLTDDKGQVAESYSLIGPGYPYRYNEAADPYIFTKDVQAESLRPLLEVIGKPAGKTAPAVPGDLKVISVQPSTSTVTLAFTVPAGNLLAYEVTYVPVKKETSEKGGSEQSLPRWEIPLPIKAGTIQQMPIWTLAPGDYKVALRAIDMAGHRSEPAIVQITVPPLPQMNLAAAPQDECRPRTEKVWPLALGDGQVYVVPDNVKIDPVSGAVLQGGDHYRIDENYAIANPIFKAGSNSMVRLQAAANEVVAFQVIVAKGEQPLVKVNVALDALTSSAGKIAANPNVRSYRVWYIRSSDQLKRQLGPNEVEDVTIRPVAWHGDAALPLSAPFEQTADVPAADNNIEGQTHQAIWVDMYVPKDTKPGTYKTEVTIGAEGIASARIPVEVEVLPLVLPDASSWIVELNSYGNLLAVAGVSDKDPKAIEAQWGFYRLSKEHRQMFNAIPYKQSGHVDMAAPIIAGDGADAHIADWSAFERFYGPLLDGSAFTSEKGYVGPNAGTPISQMYTAFHENWPLPLKKWYQDYAPLKTRLDYASWAKTSRQLDEAFPQEYKKGYRAIAQQFAEHCHKKGWTGTTYHIFGNNKYYFKVPYFASQLTDSHASGSCFWLLDEPVDHDDYMANAFFLDLAQQGLKAAKTPDVTYAYRTDVSQPEMSRSLWNNICNLWVLGGGSLKSGYVTTATVRQRWLQDEKFWHYGGGPNLSAAPINVLQVFLASWASGSSGMLPYWTTDGGRSWGNPGDPDLALFYTGRNYANSGKDYPGPLPSVRLKTMRRAQQDIEYMHLLAAKQGWDRATVRQALAPYADDPEAPVLEFYKMDASRQFGLRRALTATLLEGHKEQAAEPEPKPSQE